MTAADLLIRDAAAEDWPAIWAFMEPIVRAGETFSWDRSLVEDDAAHGGRGVGRALAQAAVERARTEGFRGMQFNAVVATNERAVALWLSLGFEILATVPDGFEHPTQGYVGLHIMYRAL
jgi:GNAT superfamily N-acetyltransferase